MDTADGPWTVIQNRADGEVKFNRTWEEYKNGFGDLNGNFWLGNEAIHHLTLKPSSLRIELVSGSNDDGHAQYSAFRVGSEMDNYRLSVSGFSGNISDAMAKHDGMQFSTFDRDNDQWKWSCARASSGGWWYKNCVHANLNGGKYNNKLWDFFYNTTQRCRMKKTKMLMKTIF
ncbi:angiopoietin-related protein 7-like [Ylistrum balloti]|uniref:angiopoietin-related protein 7-like n=1 Tax=Ylistrum balloti TaxID=509963 RepID=UPI002905B08F|nr:angiopoietin-related protein 7-like [Ylistrum balloti]